MFWQRNWPLAALVATALILIVPLWCVVSPAMPDYPARLASFYLLGTDQPNRFYHIVWTLAPNLASEVMVPLLAKVLGLEAAAKLFLSLGVMMWVVGGGILQRALFGRITPAPLAGALFAYNGNFLWGFFNYYFAAGLVLLVFAAWIAAADRRGPWRIAGFAIAATLVYGCHVFAAAILLVMIASFEASRAGFNVRGLLRRAGMVFVIFLPSALLFLLRPANADMRIEFNLADTMMDRFESLIGTGFDQPAHALPIILLMLLALALVLRRARLHPAMRLGLAALLAGALLAPEFAMGGWAVHLRLPAFFCAALFTATELRLPPLAGKLFAGVMLAVAAWNAIQLAASWQGFDRQYGEFRAALTHLPRGQRLLTVLDDRGVESDQPYWHMAEFGIIDRGDMTSLMFTTKGQHVVQLGAPFDGTAAASAQQGSPPQVGELFNLAAGRAGGDADIKDVFPYLLRFQCHYDEAMVVHMSGLHSKAPALMTVRHEGSFFTLYDIRPDGSCA